MLIMTCYYLATLILSAPIGWKKLKVLKLSVILFWIYHFRIGPWPFVSLPKWSLAFLFPSLEMAQLTTKNQFFPFLLCRMFSNISSSSNFSWRKTPIEARFEFSLGSIQLFTLSTGQSDVINKFYSIVERLCWNKTLWLVVAEHLTRFKQTEWFISG